MGGGGSNFPSPINFHRRPYNTLALLCERVINIHCDFCCVKFLEVHESVNPLVAFSDMNIDDFWKWTDFSSYVQFVAMFTLLASVVTFMFLRSPYYVELLGLLALMTEAMLGVPQFYQNYRNKSTEGMR